MKKWHIVTPLSLEAQIALDTDEAKDEDLLQISFDEIVANQLWNANIFDAINKLSPKALIDDYESAEITDLAEMSNIIVFIENNLATYPIYLQGIISDLILLFKKAVAVKTGIYFFF